jgi:hypothetical protein
MIYLALLIQFVFAVPSQKFPQDFERSHLQQALQRGHLQEIKKMGPQGYRELRQMMFSDSEPMEQRWKAIFAMAKIGQQESREDLKLSLQSRTWFVRSAGLLALSLIEEDKGAAVAKKMMQSDPALLVRASALQVLVQGQNVDRSFLWQELYNPINFHQGRGLSIRKSILKILSENPQPSEKNRFALLSNEKDESIKTLAKKTLENRL